jgi:peptide/nickel transport system permease protein
VASVNSVAFFSDEEGDIWLTKALGLCITVKQDSLMTRFIGRRLTLLPLILLLVNFTGFAFAHITFQLQQSQTIYGSGSEGLTPVWPEYTAYLRDAAQGDLGKMPIGVSEPLAGQVARAGLASLGLLGLVFTLSSLLGVALGLAAVRVEPPGVRPWLILVATIGLAMPSFFIGILLVGGLLLLSRDGEAATLLPVAGYGWDAHLVLPVLVLMIRPTVQVAQVTAGLLAGELGKRYVIAARSFGHTWHAIRWEKALRNVLAQVFLSIAGAFRSMVAELVLVEWLFSWPGVGRLLVQALVPPRISSLGGLVDTSAYFLHPALIATLLVAFALLFLLADTLASGLARAVDPRLRAAEQADLPAGGMP